ncbi:enhanced serine sensitivity protein SseB C-terminal domain-containing protein [Streptomyces humicola]|uniref:enhanced serine sensitivity protein SseB C-terminal domain-containing protein n=1 Tax=Streptomyces humicola TaxID=2953240 RepID=UPI00355805C5
MGGIPQSGVELALRQVVPGRLDAYEALLHALGDGQVWMLLWQGQPGSPDAQYGNMDVDGHGYAPCVTSALELTASRWSRSHEIVTGRAIAAELYRERWGLWLNPHDASGGVGIPWLDLRRVAVGLDRVPAGPLTITEPALQIPQFYALLTQTAYRTPVVRALRTAWVHPAFGEAFLAIGVELYDNSPQSGEAVRGMVQHAAAGAPAGLPLSTVAMADEYDPVAMWMRAFARPLFDREAYGTTVGATGPIPGGAPGPVPGPPPPSVPPQPAVPLPGGAWPTAQNVQPTFPAPGPWPRPY